MPVERPTFHESWYRVAPLHPRLRSTVQITRQFFRGQHWHVVQDHSNLAFFRLSDPAYHFIALLDGKRTVGDAWRICNDQLGDDAPTQGEAIQLMGQLYTSNLLMAELPSDTNTLFNRYKKRRTREVQSYLMNLMFIRLPLLDPDAWLERWLPMIGWIFSPVGFVVWMALLGIGLYNLAGRPNWTAEFFNSAQGVLDPSNLFLLYIGFAFTKACHEMGHAISCKKFGKQAGTGGEVHTIGIMFLVFTPVPYVDASSSWAFTNKWHRMIVGAAGMWVELAIASIAAVVWSHTQTGTVHSLAYNMMFVASISTVIFNANPLLRYDGYYILSDLLEIPNLAQRSKEFIYYLVKKYIWNVRYARNPAYSHSEQAWLFVYAISSAAMRMVVSFGILLYLASVLEGPLIIIATAMVVAAVITWVFLPIGKFIHYLATNAELSRVRGRAVITTLIVFAGLVGAFGMIPAHDRSRAQGVVEPLDFREVYMGQEGGIVDVNLAAFPTGTASYGMPIVNDGQQILSAESIELKSLLAQEEAELAELKTRMNMAFVGDPNKGSGPPAAALFEIKVNAKREEIVKTKARLETLKRKATTNGVFISDGLEYKNGMQIKAGEKIGMIASLDLDRLIIRTWVPNEIAGTVYREAKERVEIRVMGRPDILLEGYIKSKGESSHDRLPSAALGYAAGGATETTHDDKEGKTAAERGLEVRINRLKFIKPIDNIRVTNVAGKVAAGDSVSWGKGEMARVVSYDDKLQILSVVEASNNIPAGAKIVSSSGGFSGESIEQVQAVSARLLSGQRVIVRFEFADKPFLVQAWTSLRQLFQKKFH